MLTFKHGQINCATFDGIGELADYVTSGPAAACPYMTTDENWAGAKPTETLRRIAAGDDKLTARADAALARVEATAEFATSRFAVVPAVAGGAPCVPSYLAGNPLAMRRRVQIASDSAPIAVCIDIGVSASVSAETIERRGVAALALARVLSASRAVSLWAVCGEQISQFTDDKAEALFAVKIDTAPIDVSRTAWLMAAPEAFRRVGFSACQAIGGHPEGRCVNWLFDDGKKHLEAVADLLPQLTGCSEMVYLPRLWTDGAEQFATDKQAAAWVRAELLRLGALAE